MSGEWREVNLDQIGRIITGKTPSSRKPEYFGGDIPFITPSDFNGLRRISSTERHLTEQGATAVRGALITGDAVMVSCIGSDMGESAMTVSPCVTNQQINSLIVNPENDPLFIYYNLSNRKGEIRSYASGSAVPILNKSEFGQLRILLPPLPEQQAIAHILGTLDDKIELNRRMNQTLEAMARAIFQDWFVDFGPVRAKLEGQESYLPPELWELFPDRLVESELGAIPEGWGVKRLDGLLRAKNQRVGDDIVPEYSSTNNGLQPREQYFKKQLSKGASKNKLVHRGDLVFGLSRRILNFGIMRDDIGSVSPAYRVFARGWPHIDFPTWWNA